MKRSTYYLSLAKHKAMLAVAYLAGVSCGCVWSVRAAQDSTALGGAGFVLTLAGLTFALMTVRDAIRLAAEADRSARIEWEKRPITRI